jgi:hypothetical protein
MPIITKVNPKPTSKIQNSNRISKIYEQEAKTFTAFVAYMQQINHAIQGSQATAN